MRLVGVAHHLGGATGQRRAEHGLAERRVGGAGTEVVGGPADGDLDVAGRWASRSSSVIAARVAALAEVGCGGRVSTRSRPSVGP